jgi:hypothetical protein
MKFAYLLSFEYSAKENFKFAFTELLERKRVFYLNKLFYVENSIFVRLIRYIFFKADDIYLQ